MKLACLPRDWRGKRKDKAASRMDCLVFCEAASEDVACMIFSNFVRKMKFFWHD